MGTGCGFAQRSPDQLSSQIDNIHIIRLASSSSTRCEGDLASGKTRIPMVPPVTLK